MYLHALTVEQTDTYKDLSGGDNRMNSYKLYSIVNKTMNEGSSHGIVEFDGTGGVKLVSGTVHGLHHKLFELYERYNILMFYDEGEIIIYQYRDSRYLSF